MSLSRIAELSRPAPGPTCGIGMLIAGAKGLKESDRKTLEQAIAGDPEIFRASGISKWLADDCGVEISASSVSRHRRGLCRCV